MNRSPVARNVLIGEPKCSQLQKVDRYLNCLASNALRMHAKRLTAEVVELLCRFDKPSKFQKLLNKCHRESQRTRIERASGLALGCTAGSVSAWTQIEGTGE